MRADMTLAAIRSRLAMRLYAKRLIHREFSYAEKREYEGHASPGIHALGRQLGMLAIGVPFVCTNALKVEENTT